MQLEELQFTSFSQIHRGANPAVPVRQPRTEANSDGIAEYLRYKWRQPNSCRHFLICPSYCQPSSSSLRWRYCPTPKDHPLHHETDTANHAGRCGRNFSEDIPRNGKRTAQSITNLHTNRELVGASTAPLPLLRQAPLPFWTKYAVLGGSLRRKIIRRRDRFRSRGQVLRAQRGHDHRRDHHLARRRGEVPRHL